METTQREWLIKEYINAYNNFDVEGMLRHLDPNIQFENISNGQVSLSVNGREELRAQAEQATTLFKSREQVIKFFEHVDEDQTEVEIDFYGVLAADMANGLRKGSELNVSGKSIFKFSDDSIVEITDIS
jgi:hypothetical protein